MVSIRQVLDLFLQSVGQLQPDDGMVGCGGAEVERFEHASTVGARASPKPTLGAPRPPTACAERLFNRVSAWTRGSSPTET